MILRFLVVISLAVLGFTNQHVSAATAIRVLSGLSRPLYVTAPLQDYDRIFIVEQYTARIKILHFSTGDIDTFLHIDSLVIGSGNERGLLGLCFHLDYESNGYFYVHYNDNSGNSQIARFSVSANPDSADASSRFNILHIVQPSGANYQNHKGGMIAFGPDGYLYIGMGDGGSGNDPGNRAQSDTTLLGKMLRIDLDGGSPFVIPPDNPFPGLPFPRNAIWAKGVRNPWRWSFDRVTHDLYIGDVGQNNWEEVDFQPSTSDGGENYAWRCMEGQHCTGLSGCTCNDPALTDPIHEYSHNTGCSITGGFVYRGCAIPEFNGLYFFAEYCTDQIWSGQYDSVNDTLAQITNRTDQFNPGGGLTIGDISSFGEDAYGELYICDLLGGEVFKIVPDTLVDCNNNNIADLCDIASGMSADTNANDIPDECECIPVEVTDLTTHSAGDNIVLRWSATGESIETYTVYRSVLSYAPFPGPEWTVLASSLPSVIGENAMIFTDSTGVAEGDRHFYIVTSNCP